MNIVGSASKQSWSRYDSKPAFPAYIVTLVIPVGELVEVIDEQGADHAAVRLGRAVLEEIRQLEGEIART